jgi:uncharacterized protein YbaR (Trm112 family)
MRQRLSVERPELIDEWDFEKNIGIFPDEFSAGSERKVWWKCESGHSWQAKIYSRTEGRGCPVCARNRVKPGVNDLATRAPELASEWDYEKNGALTPGNVISGSNTKYWWRCKLGHRWQASVNKRYNGKRNCPYCSGNKVWKGFNDISTTHPELAKEWDYGKNGVLRPEQFSAGADIKIWWKCEYGHSWQALVYSRKNCGCPVCAGNILTVGINDLQTINPAVAAEWDSGKNTGLCPDSVAANDNRKVWWLCASGHSWQAVISSRNSGRGCPYCSRRYVLTGFNDLLTEAPKLAMEWDYEKNDPLRPETIVGTSHESVWWICRRGHSWKTQIVNRRIGTNCPYCAGKLVIPGETDLKTLRPNLVSEWDFEKNGLRRPEQVTAQSHWRVWWKCSRGHSYQAMVSHRFRGNGCPYCAGKLPILGETDLRTVHPELISEWDFMKNDHLRPENFTAASHKKIWWRCEEGHSWRTAIYHRHIGHGCPYCVGLLAICGETDIGTVNPILAKEWDFERNANILLDETKPYSNKKVWWICPRGHHWLSTVGARHAGSGCPYCRGKIQMRTRLVK